MPDTGDPSLDDLSFVVLDTETTGLQPRHDRIVSLAAVRVRGGAVERERLDTLVHPGRPIPLASTRIHGITDGMVRDAPTIDAVLAGLLRFVGTAVVVGHEIAFDLAFLRPETDRLGLPPLHVNHVVLDTAAMASALHGPGLPCDLDAVAARLGVRIPGRHTALGDAIGTAEVFLALLGLARSRSIRTLGQLRAFTGGLSGARRPFGGILPPGR